MGPTNIIYINGAPSSLPHLPSREHPEIGSKKHAKGPYEDNIKAQQLVIIKSYVESIGLATIQLDAINIYFMSVLSVPDIFTMLKQMWETHTPHKRTVRMNCLEAVD
jgi:hypothetical protein